MFEATPLNPPDAIFGLNEEFKQDSNPDKINLTVGMYQDEAGQTPIMKCVHQAETILVEKAGSHVYLPISGMVEYNHQIPKLILGSEHSAIAEGRILSAQTPGGTGALRVAGELLKRNFNLSEIWISNPTWANHNNIFPAAGLEIRTYQYLDQQGNGFDFEAMMESISAIPAHSAILLHTVCHNPTGVDPTVEQWAQILQVIRDRELMPVFDFAYQGFGESIDADAHPIRAFCTDQAEALICSSFSKNFNLYGERVGAISAVAKSASSANAVMSQIKKIIRTVYSNPPMHGAAIVSTVFSDPQLQQQWLDELDAIRVRIGELRKMFVEAMSLRMPNSDFGFMQNQRGMFSYSGLSGEVADRLKKEHSIYLLRSGRINVAGINSNNLPRLCDAIAKVLEQKKAG
ncbi:MAG: amino acid aminotransferase [Planctomycetota bacterium]